MDVNLGWSFCTGFAWSTSPDFPGYTEKQNLQKTLFPSGILYDKEKHNYLTPEINSFVLLTKSISMECGGNKNGINHQKNEKSHLVAGTGIEPVFAP